MVNKVQVLLLTAVIFLTIAGSVKIDLPGHVIPDLRVAMPPVAILLSLSVIIDRRTKSNFFKLLDTTVGLMLSALLLLTAVSLYVAPTIYIKLLSTITLSIACFTSSYLLTVNKKTSQAMEKAIVVGTCIASLIASSISLMILVGGEFGIELAERLVESSNYRYILYDLGRGRIYPIFPPTYFIGIITSVYLLKIKENKNVILFLFLLGTGIISLYASNYRILSLVGTIGIIYAGAKILNINWWKIAPVVFVVGLIPALLLPTNIIKRSILVDYNDAKSIEGRLTMVARYVNLAIDNNFKAVGFGNATEAEDYALENRTGIFPTNQNPHNIYLQLLVEGGIPVAFAYGALILLFVILDFRLLYIKKLNPLLGVLSLTCLLFFLTSAVERHSFNVFVYIFTIQGLVYGKSVTMGRG